ncbi:MAG: 2-oxoacid:acceptor oxidoreductase subunit alpha [Planctomycetes bacterium]|nr:2-oxoacid:acceptor oxidoreductase subunit alpha [Planctomycetota bacterium]
MSDDISVLIGGKAGDGINQAGLLIARLLNQLGRRLYLYIDYPSLIRGGHNFALIRAADKKIATHRDEIDFLLALNQDAVDLHKKKLKKQTCLIYDSDVIKDRPDIFPNSIGLPLTKIIKEAKAPVITRNSCLIGGFCKAAGIDWDILEKVFRKSIPKETELNLKLARQGYDQAKESVKIQPGSQKSLPILTGNEAIGLGLVQAGLQAYVAYPMTPATSILHFLAQQAEKFYLKVIHPENEISVILMALGFAYTGQRVAVGTSGGGFCLMTEGLSLSGVAELPVVVVLSQRPGPSTGLPTYTAQSELNFALNAGHGDFTRLVVAPGDIEEAYYWSAVSLNLSWKYQIPVIILVDKALSEGGYSFDIDSVGKVQAEPALSWDGKNLYQRYLDTTDGISPLVSVPDKNAVVKVNSYEHDEAGITIEDPQRTIQMNDKRQRKEKSLIKALEKYSTVSVGGNEKSDQALVCWGSNKGVCTEVAEQLGLKVIQPVVLNPFPVRQYQEALKGVKKIICVENNVAGQLARLLNQYGFPVDEKILKYDGRSFSLEELAGRVKGKLS